MLKLVQITDLHIGKEGEDTYGIDVRGNFLKVLEASIESEPDAIVLSGDLCYSVGDREVYKWVKQQMDATKIPYHIISGNHDDSKMLIEGFGLQKMSKNGYLYYTLLIDNQQIIFLDSAEYDVKEEQLIWLENELSKIKQDVVVFIHHPPALIGAPFMDNKHSLKNIDEVQAILFKHPHKIRTFSGHYHCERVWQSNNVTAYVTPATFFQINPHNSEFEVDHKIPAWREIVLDGETLQTTVRYLN